MRRKNGVRSIEDRIAHLYGIGAAQIQSGARKLAVSKRLGDGVMVHDAFPGNIDEKSAGFHAGQALGVDKTTGEIGAPKMHRENIGGVKKLVFVYHCCFRSRGSLRSERRAPGNDLKSKDGGALGHRASGSSQPENSKSFSFKFHSGRTIPAPFAQGMIQLTNAASKRKNHSKNVLRNRAGRSAGRCRNDNAQLGRGLDIDPVRARVSDQP